MPVFFHIQGIDFKLKHKQLLKVWLKQCIENESHTLGEISIVIGGDEWLKSINNQHLKHNYYTDVITFDNAVQANIIAGDILISKDRIEENARAFEVSFENELARVMIHGVLHLIGYNDKQPSDKIKMTKKEDRYLNLLGQLRST